MLCVAAVPKRHGPPKYRREYMRGASMGLLVVGIVVVLLGAVNHFAIHANPIAHTSTIAGAIGAVLVVIGVVMMAMGGKSSAA